MLPASRDRLPVNRQRWVCSRQGEWDRRVDGRKKRQYVVDALVHELAVACPGAEGQRLAADDGTEELVVVAYVLAQHCGSVTWLPASHRTLSRGAYLRRIIPGGAAVLKMSKPQRAEV